MWSVALNWLFVGLDWHTKGVLFYWIGESPCSTKLINHSTDHNFSSFLSNLASLIWIRPIFLPGIQKKMFRSDPSNSRKSRWSAPKVPSKCSTIDLPLIFWVLTQIWQVWYEFGLFFCQEFRKKMFRSDPSKSRKKSVKNFGTPSLPLK